jgi:hypothetical protein
VAVDDVYVLGAGASYVHGAPLTDELLPYALSLSPNRNDPRLGLVREFLRDVFHFTTPRGPSRRASPARRIAGSGVRPTLGAEWPGGPSLVDVLSVVDVALDRKESLARRYDVERLRRVRTALEFAIFEALEDSLRWRPPTQRWRRSGATHALANRLEPDRAAVISFNYDVIADIALAMRGRAFNFERANLEALGQGDHQAIDYGIEFVNVEPEGESRGRSSRTPGPFPPDASLLQRAPGEERDGYPDQENVHRDAQCDPQRVPGPASSPRCGQRHDDVVHDSVEQQSVSAAA